MLTSVKFINSQGTTLEIPMNGTTEYRIKGISGLGPVKADVLTAEYVNVPGGVYQGIKNNMRNIVVLLDYNPSFTSNDPYGDLRRGLYPWFGSGNYIEVQFISDNFVTVKATGYIEDMLPTIFTKEPEVQVSILCPDTYLYGITPITTGTVIGSGSHVVTNPGHVDSGMDILVKRLYAASGIEFKMTQTAPLTSEMTYDGSRFTDFVVLHIVTTPGQKSAQYMYYDEYNNETTPARTLRGDLGWINVLGYMTNWLQVKPGENTFSSVSTSLAQVTFSFVPKYKGL